VNHSTRGRVLATLRDRMRGSGRVGHHRGCLLDLRSRAGDPAGVWVGDDSVVITAVLSALGSVFLAAAIIVASRRDR